MKADDIRSMGLELVNKVKDENGINTLEKISSAMLCIGVTFLIEIAAQLAEINERENSKRHPR